MSEISIEIIYAGSRLIVRLDGTRVENKAQQRARKQWSLSAIRIVRSLWKDYCSGQWNIHWNINLCILLNWVPKMNTWARKFYHNIRQTYRILHTREENRGGWAIIYRKLHFYFKFFSHFSGDSVCFVGLVHTSSFRHGKNNIEKVAGCLKTTLLCLQIFLK